MGKVYNFVVLVKAQFKVHFGLLARFANLAIKMASMLMGFATAAAVQLFDFNAQDVAFVSAVSHESIPQTLPSQSYELSCALFVPAMLISIIDFV